VHKVTLKPTYVQKTQKVSANETAKRNLIGLTLYLSYLSKSDPLCGRHLVEQCDLTKQVHRERRLYSKQRPPPASIKFSAKQLWSSCSSATQQATDWSDACPHARNTICECLPTRLWSSEHAICSQNKGWYEPWAWDQHPGHER